ncbi:MAG: DUF2330 domain-containing protein [Sandaracinaceae bacterium]
MRLASHLVVFALLLSAAPASAFCGFYVAPGESELKNDATMVVMMREGTRTVLSMRNDYQGPARDFAMVVPVPVVLQESDVRTLPAALFERVDRLAAPRLVEYWEQDPCAMGGTLGLGGLGVIGRGAGGGGGSGFGRGAGRLQVRVEAEFEVGEYEIVILGADDSSDLETWLRQHHYRIPDGAAAALQPYVASGQKFFVARVDVDRVRFEDGRAVLSPLRLHYDSDTFQLPVRLGMLNSSGTQDLLVHILSRAGRFEAANYDNVTIPTNFDVRGRTRGSFGSFYAALFDRTREAHPGAVVTEYAWQSSSCDPCPGPVLSPQDLMTLGADVAIPGMDAPPGPTPGPPVVSPPSIPEAVVQRIARRHQNALAYCFRGQPGTAEINLIVDEDGHVAASRVETHVAGGSNRGVDACATRAVRRWRFPEPRPASSAVRVRHVVRVAGRGMNGLNRFVLTRLHHRYDQGQLGEDLVFRAASPIQGGREHTAAGAQQSASNNFQGRYAIRHPWTGPIRCENPVRGVWGGPPTGGDAPVRPALDTAAVSRRAGLERYLTAASRDAVPASTVATPRRPRRRRQKQASRPVSAPLVRAAACSLTPGEHAGGLSMTGLLLVAWAFRRRRISR